DLGQSGHLVDDAISTRETGSLAGLNGDTQGSKMHRDGHDGRQLRRGHDCTGNGRCSWCGLCVRGSRDKSRAEQHETKGSEMHDSIPERLSAVAACNITHSNLRAPDNPPTPSCGLKTAIFAVRNVPSSNRLPVRSPFRNKHRSALTVVLRIGKYG